MELKLGSVWLLLSCSLQQSLWGILASVPQTNAKKCISDQGEVRKVQMLKRIPARCSGWDEAWSWLSQKDCRTKYKMDYVELPSAIQKGDNKDCEPSDSQAAKAEGENYFNVSDEKFLAIAFGSATVALLILIVIIVLSLVRRGQICGTCCGSPTYRTANASERESREENQRACNAYVEDGLTLMESEYEEILDPSTKEKKQAIQEEKQGNKYQNVPLYPNDELKALEKGNFPISNGVVVPSAPLEEDLHQNHVESVPNDYTDFIGHENSVKTMHSNCGNSVSRFTLVGKDLLEGSNVQHCDSSVKSDDCNSSVTIDTKHADESQGSCVQNNVSGLNMATVSVGIGSNCNVDNDKEKQGNQNSEFSDIVKAHGTRSDVEDDGSFTDYEEPLSAPISSHSYENLNPETQDLKNKTMYDSLAHSPVYCEPRNVSNSIDGNSPLSKSHVTVTGSQDNHSDRAQTGLKLQTENKDSITEKSDSLSSNKSNDENQLDNFT